MNICCYISSHGFGHATRTFAILKELTKKDINIFIRANLPNWLIKNSFKDNNLKYINNFETLKVFHHSDKLTFEKIKTINYIKNYFLNYDERIKKEIQFCKENQIDLILSDIEPIAFEVAYECEIDSIAISNFTWFDIYREILINESKILERIKNAYKKASLLFRLPFHFEMSYFKEIIDVPLIFRKLTRSKREIKSILDLNSSDKLISIQFGGHNFSFLKVWNNKIQKFHKKNPNIYFLINRFSKGQILDSIRHIFKNIPAKDVETQDYISISDLIIGKTGYSLVSEVVGYKTPFFYTIREKWIEDKNLKIGIENYGIGKFYSRTDLINGIWIDEISFGMNLKNTQPKKLIEKYGQDEIVKYILKRY